MEKYNKYGESLNLDCNCKGKSAIKKTHDCGCGGINLPSHNNEIEILIKQLKREVKELMKTTQAKLLCQDKKIAETMVYIKNNLSNSIRDLLDSMQSSGELDQIITDIILSELDAKFDFYKVNTLMSIGDIISITSNSRPKIISFEKGIYNFSYPIVLTSNTIFLFNNSTINCSYRNESNDNILFMGYGKNDVVYNYDGVHDVEFINGNFNTCFAFMHNKNIKFTNCNFIDDIKGHAVQISACKNIIFDNCTFNGTLKSDSESTQDIIQLEYCNYSGQPYLDECNPSYDGTINQYIEIKNCKFNSPSDSKNAHYVSIGSHSIGDSEDVYNDYIKIHDCEFNIPEVFAIHLVGFNNTEIYNNIFNLGDNTTNNSGITNTWINKNINIYNNKFYGGIENINQSRYELDYQRNENINIYDNYFDGLNSNATNNNSIIRFTNFVNSKISNNIANVKVGSFVRIRTNDTYPINVSENIYITDNITTQISNPNLGAKSYRFFSGSKYYIINNTINNINEQGAFAFTSDVEDIMIDKTTLYDPIHAFDSDYMPTSFNQIYNLYIPLLNGATITNQSNITLSKNFNQFTDLLLNTGTTDNRKWIPIKHYNNPNAKLIGSQTYRGILLDTSNNSNNFVFTLNSNGTVNYNCTVALRDIYGINKS